MAKQCQGAGWESMQTFDVGVLLSHPCHLRSLKGKRRARESERVGARAERTSSSGAMKTFGIFFFCCTFQELLDAQRPTRQLPWELLGRESVLERDKPHPPPLLINQCARRPAAASCLVRLDVSQGVMLSLIHI